MVNAWVVAPLRTSTSLSTSLTVNPDPTMRPVEMQAHDLLSGKNSLAPVTEQMFQSTCRSILEATTDVSEPRVFVYSPLTQQPVTISYTLSPDNDYILFSNDEIDTAHRVVTGAPAPPIPSNDLVVTSVPAPAPTTPNLLRHSLTHVTEPGFDDFHRLLRLPSRPLTPNPAPAAFDMTTTSPPRPSATSFTSPGSKVGKTSSMTGKKGMSQLTNPHFVT